MLRVGKRFSDDERVSYLFVRPWYLSKDIVIALLNQGIMQYQVSFVRTFIVGLWEIELIISCVDISFDWHLRPVYISVFWYLRSKYQLWSFITTIISCFDILRAIVYNYRIDFVTVDPNFFFTGIRNFFKYGWTEFKFTSYISFWLDIHWKFAKYYKKDKNLKKAGRITKIIYLTAYLILFHIFQILFCFFKILNIYMN